MGIRIGTERYKFLFKRVAVPVDENTSLRLFRLLSVLRFWGVLGFLRVVSFLCILGFLRLVGLLGILGTARRKNARR